MRRVPDRPRASTFFGDPVAFAASHPAELVRLRAFTGEQALVQSPDEAWRVLVTDAGQFRQGKWKRRARRFLGPTLNTLDGSEHRARRLLLQPALERRRIHSLAPKLVDRAVRAQESWRHGDRIGLRATLDPLSLAMAGDVLLGVDLGPQAPELARALNTVMSHLPRLTPPLPGTAQARALARVHVTARGLLGAAGADAPPDSLLGILRADGLPRETCVGELTAFLLAAVDEPPSGLAAVWYFLASDPEREARFHAELDAAGEDQPAPNALPYVEAVLAEALRILPPARHVDRCPASDTVVCGVPIPAGTNVLLSPLVLHHATASYDAPETFDPERWLDGRREQVPRGAYVPFGAGPHTCIGEPLARLIMTVTLAAIGRRWRLRLDDDARPPIPGRPDLQVVLERR